MDSMKGPIDFLLRLKAIKKLGRGKEEKGRKICPDARESDFWLDDIIGGAGQRGSCQSPRFFNFRATCYHHERTNETKL